MGMIKFFFKLPDDKKNLNEEIKEINNFLNEINRDAEKLLYYIIMYIERELNEKK